MCVCIHVCVCACMSVPVCVCVSIIIMCVLIYMYVHVCMYMCVRTCLCYRALVGDECDGGRGGGGCVCVICYKEMFACSFCLRRQGQVCGRP